MFVNQLQKGNGEIARIVSFLKANERPVVLFGAGAAGEAMLFELSKLGVPVAAFSDNDEKKYGTMVYGHKVISLADLEKKYRDAVIIVSIGSPAAKAVEEQLNLLNCFYRVIGFFFAPSEFSCYESYVESQSNEFETLYSFLADDKSREVLKARLNCLLTNNLLFPPHLVDEHQYFDERLIRFHRDEVFLDIGAYDGQTATEFAQRALSYRKVICMEPEKSNYQRLLEHTVALQRVQTIRMGAWSEKASFPFAGSGFSSRIADEGGSGRMEVAPIDELLYGEPVTYLKMDIEGAECEALKGAQMTIMKYKPRLAICVYHKRCDILNVPRFIKDLDLGYRLYLRHYGPTIYETVCYAI